MKICFIIHDFLPNYKAGTENATYFLARELAKQHDVHIFTTEPKSSQPGYVDAYEEAGFFVHKIHTNNDFPKDFKETYYQHDLENDFIQYLDNLKPDVVHVQHLINFSISFLRIIHNMGIPIVYTVHDFWFQCPFIRKYRNGANCIGTKHCNQCISSHYGVRAAIVQPGSRIGNFISKCLKIRFVKRFTYIFVYQSGFVSFFVRILNLFKGSGQRDYIGERNRAFRTHFEYVDQFVCPSEFLAHQLIAFGVPKAKVNVVAHGIPTEIVQLNKSRDYVFGSHISFYFISHIAEEKGFILLFNSFKEVAKAYKETSLHIFGSYDEKDQKIANIITSLKGDVSISYEGVFNNTKLAEILRGADVIVVPSLWNEIYGLVVDEARLHGIPVIVSNRGGLPERVKDKVDGFIFDSSKPETLKDVMMNILKDPTRLNSVKNRQPSVKSIKEYALEMEDLYSRL